MNMMSLRRRIMGVEKTLLPKEYQQVEYIETPEGQHSYIDANTYITEDLRFIIDFQVIGTIITGYYIMGVYSNTNNHFYLYVSSDKTYQTAYACAWHNTSVKVDNERHTFDYCYKSGNMVVTERDVPILQVTATPTSSAKINFAS